MTFQQNVRKRSRNTVPATGWELQKQLNAQRGRGTPGGTPGGHSGSQPVGSSERSFLFLLWICRTRLAGHWGTISVPAPSRFWPADNSWISCLPPGRCDIWTAAAKSLQPCPTLCDPIGSSPPGSPVPGILQARTLEWVAISFSSDIWTFSQIWKHAKEGTSEDSHQRPGDGSAERIFLKISLYFEIWFSKKVTYSCWGRNRH